MAIAVFLISFVVFLFIGVPVCFSLGATSLLTGVVIWGIDGVPLATLAQRILAGVNNFTTLAIPLFLLCGQLMNEGDLTEKIFNIAQDCVGHLRGGLGYVNVLGSVIFAGMSGSAPADAAGLGSIEIKAMTESGFDAEFSAAVTGCSALISPIIPPSVSMVMYGVLTSCNVSALFMGGIIPGLLMALAQCYVVHIFAKKRNYPISPKPTRKKFFEDLKESIFPLLAPVIIVGGVWSGWFTPTESAGIAVFYMLILILVVYKTMKVKEVWNFCKRAIIDCSAILMVMACVSVYSYVLNLTNVPKIVATAILGLTTNPIIIMLMLVAFLLFIGCFMSTMQSIMLFTPIFLPILQGAGVDLLVFGVVMCITLAVGQMTPPFGTVLFIVTKISKVPLNRVVISSLPFLGSVVFVILLCVFFPQLVTFIPRTFA